MKRSEMRKVLLEKGGTLNLALTEELLTKMDEVADWDPEEEPLPKSIYASFNADGVPVLCVPGVDGIGEVVAPATYGEAVRRYNLIPKLREMAKRWGPTARGLETEFLYVLDGKEGA